jgi:tetratricopeptide (TPR) repeat protein
MLKITALYFFISIFFTQHTYGQYEKEIDSICVICNIAQTDSERIHALDLLAEYYYIYELNAKADSLLKLELQIADLSNNSNLEFEAYFGNSTLNVNPSSPSESLDEIEQFLENGIQFAKSQNRNDYIALGYTRLADLLIKKGENKKALENAGLAIESIQYIQSDSLKAVIYIELGNAYKANEDLVSSIKNYNTAFDIASKINSIPLESEVYHATSAIYSFLGIDTEAKEELEQSLKLNKENKYFKGMVRDYYDLAKLTAKKFYLDEAIRIADSIRYPYYLLAAKKVMLFYIAVQEQDSRKALTYLETEPDLRDAYSNVGIANYYSTKAEVYLYCSKPDSALYYFKLAEDDYLGNFDKKSKLGFLWEMGETCRQLEDWPDAINYLTKALDLSKQMNDLSDVVSISNTLSSVYGNLGSYKQAYNFSKQAVDFQDQLNQHSKQNEIILAGVERENRKHAEEIQRQHEQMLRNRDLQFMSITVIIGIIFLVILILGAFPVTKLTIKLLGYFFFISVFEFIILFIDNILLNGNIHYEPLKLWLIKIALIAALVPMQHFLEHNLIKFLQSRKLLEARTRFSIKEWWKKITHHTRTSKEEFDDETAVL